jgi:TonB family protein
MVEDHAAEAQSRWAPRRMRTSTHAAIAIALIWAASRCSTVSMPPPRSVPLSSASIAAFEGAVRITQPSELPKIVNRQEPWVPDSLMRVNAVAIVEVFIGEDGGVVGTRHIGGDPAFFQAAADAAQQWRFEPLIRDGHPAKFVVPFTFSLTWHTNPLSAKIQIRVTGSQ